jgi:hypothetical protein
VKFQSKVALWVSVSCLTFAISIASAWSMSQAGSSDSSSASKPAAAGNSGATTNQAPASSANTISKSAGKSGGGAASSSEIAAAKASGKVWVNTESGVYHKSGRWYGKTKAGKFMTESEAKAAGYKAAHRE